MDYKETIQQMISDGILSREDAEKYCPELIESEDERIRTGIISIVRAASLDTLRKSGISFDKAKTWLEKQGNKDEEILILKDQIESLHAAIKANKETNRIKFEKQGEQNPVWSEEDFPHTVGYLVQDIVANEHMPEGEKKPTSFFVKKYNKLMSISHWKPSDEQMSALQYALGEGGIYDKESLKALYNDLKKLTE